MKEQTFNLNQDFMNGYTTIFLKIVIAIIVLYGLVLVINFFRDKYINEKPKKLNTDYLELLLLLNKVFIISGWGFIISNVLQLPLKLFRPSKNNFLKNIQGDYDYLVFGVILIFIGIGLKAGIKAIVTHRKQNEE